MQTGTLLSFSCVGYVSTLVLPVVVMCKDLTVSGHVDDTYMCRTDQPRDVGL